MDFAFCRLCSYKNLYGNMCCECPQRIAFYQNKEVGKETKMNNSARWKTLIEWLNDNPDATKEDILEKISKIKRGER